jgi:cyclopropane-fatty-acyl-phospholipid synthase
MRRHRRVVVMYAPLMKVLERIIRQGDLKVICRDGKAYRFGDGLPPAVTVRFKDAATERAVAFDPQLALPEAYMHGTFTVEEGGRIYEFLDLVLRNSQIDDLPAWSRAFDAVRYLTRRAQQFNPVGRAKRNVAHHYDLDGALYDLFLDKDRQYSCAYFEPGNTDLEEAQLAKKRHIAAKMALKTGQKVLDIGSGWGGLGMYLAKAANVDVTGVTLSEEQLAVARNRVADAKLDRPVRFKLQDYRRLDGQFDRIVSVGMFEHVGVNHYGAFFRKVRDLLTDDGVAVVHTIGRSDRPTATNAFIAKHIFPGGYIPALSEVMPPIEKSGLHVTDVEILRLHYAETLREWRHRFLANWAKATERMGEEFCRMWEFYLAGSEAAFRYQNLVVFQIQLAKKVGTLPLTRDYVVEEERRLKAREQGAYAPRLAGE